MSHLNCSSCNKDVIAFLFHQEIKSIDDILVVEEAQNLTKSEMLAILTRLGKTGKIVINGDNEQRDIKDQYTGLDYVIELSKKIKEIRWVKLKHNHRSDLVGKILEYEYSKAPN